MRYVAVALAAAVLTMSMSNAEARQAQRGYGGGYMVQRGGPYPAPNWGQYQSRPPLQQAPPGMVPWHFGTGTMLTCYYIYNGRCYYY